MCCDSGSTASPPVPSASECSVSSDHGAGLASPPEPSTAVNGGRTPPRTTADDAQPAPQLRQARSAPGATPSVTDGPGRIQSEQHTAAVPMQTAQSDGATSLNGTAISRVFVKAQPCPDTSGGIGRPKTMSMEVGNLPQRGGETCNIEFSFNVSEDSVQAIIAEMQSELNLNLSEEEATIVHRKIDEELRRYAPVASSPSVSACGAMWGCMGAVSSSLHTRTHPLLYCRAQQAAGQNGVQHSAVQNGVQGSSFQFSPIPVRNGEMLEDRPGGAHFFQDARRSAFESSQGTASEERLESNESEMAGSVFTDAAVPSQNGVMPAPTPSGGSRNGVSCCKLSECAELKDNGNGENPSGPLKRVEFSELRKRFEEAHASGILRDTRA